MKLFLFFIIVGVVISCVMYIFFGWVTALMTFPFALAIQRPHRGWLAGSIITLISWAILLAANFVIAPEPSSHAVSTIAGFIGQPTFVPPVASLLIAALVGALAGMLGSGLSRFFVERHPSS